MTLQLYHCSCTQRQNPGEAFQSRQAAHALQQPSASPRCASLQSPGGPHGMLKTTRMLQMLLNATTDAFDIC